MNEKDARILVGNEYIPLSNIESYLKKKGSFETIDLNNIGKIIKENKSKTEHYTNDTKRNSVINRKVSFEESQYPENYTSKNILHKGK